ncbi:hypothetical protein [Streptomyces sp. NPDC002328]|uniref:hypothetical protein n=1 Tax=Streptomyces sp. NPDC002328 TaxID=3364642 RepID=UPI00368E1D01
MTAASMYFVAAPVATPVTAALADKEGRDAGQGLLCTHRPRAHPAPRAAAETDACDCTAGCTCCS